MTEEGVGDDSKEILHFAQNDNLGRSIPLFFQRISEHNQS